MIFLYRNTICSQGRKRNLNNRSYDISYKSTMTLPDLTDRGYTRHEHLEDISVLDHFRIDFFNSLPSNTNRSVSHTYAAYSAELWNYITGDHLNPYEFYYISLYPYGSALILIATPRMLSSSIINNPL